MEQAFSSMYKCILPKISEAIQKIFHHKSTKNFLEYFCCFLFLFYREGFLTICWSFPLNLKRLWTFFFGDILWTKDSKGQYYDFGENVGVFLLKLQVFMEENLIITLFFK
jgi:hypothetical protein